MNKKKAIRFIKLFIGLVNSCIPKYSKRVLFKTIPDYTGNGKAFSDYLIANKSEYEVVWITNISTTLCPGVRHVKKGTLLSLWFYFTSKYVITTHNEMISTKGRNQIYISLWHGMPFKKICYLGDFDYQGMEDYSSLRIATSEVMRSVISACFREKANNVYITGQPRNDFIFDNSLSLKQLGIQKEFKKIVFYAPTFRENQTDLIFSNGKKITNNNFLRTDDFNLNVLNEFLLEIDTLLLLKLHPFEERGFNKKDLATNIKVIKSDLLNDLGLDINHVLAITDILVSDYSSVYFDFMLKNKPIVFLVPDKDEYSKSRGGFILEPFDFWTPGEKVTSQVGLLEEITKLIQGDDLYKEKRLEVNSIINKYSDNKNSERVFNHFFK
ncbi:CDP-glycerol glycerophosphotransferase family protein [Morganella morganii]|uniref:CDP-glycerol glycerophosphotransferase family protein n=1 Tax=Morganellaceae TaxID=1903414 RepID=UPI0034E4AF4B